MYFAVTSFLIAELRFFFYMQTSEHFLRLLNTRCRLNIMGYQDIRQGYFNLDTVVRDAEISAVLNQTR